MHADSVANETLYIAVELLSIRKETGSDSSSNCQPYSYKRKPIMDKIPRV